MRSDVGKAKYEDDEEIDQQEDLLQSAGPGFTFGSRHPGIFFPHRSGSHIPTF